MYKFLIHTAFVLSLCCQSPVFASAGVGDEDTLVTAFDEQIPVRHFFSQLATTYTGPDDESTDRVRFLVGMFENPAELVKVMGHDDSLIAFTRAWYGKAGAIEVDKYRLWELVLSMPQEIRTQWSKRTFLALPSEFGISDKTEITKIVTGTAKPEGDDVPAWLMSNVEIITDSLTVRAHARGLAANNKRS